MAARNRYRRLSRISSAHRACTAARPPQSALERPRRNATRRQAVAAAANADKPATALASMTWPAWPQFDEREVRAAFLRDPGR